MNDRTITFQLTAKTTKTFRLWVEIFLRGKDSCSIIKKRL